VRILQSHSKTVDQTGEGAEEMFESMRRCTKCILPDTFPGIEFDEDGVCNYCLDYEPVKVYGEEELVRVLDKHRSKGKRYDCIVPISGGRDSAFVLHQIVKKFEMRALALTVDSGAIMPEGYRNIERITKVLGVDHVWLRDENQIKIAQRNAKIKFHAWLKKPSIHTIVPTLNAGDKTMNLRIYRYAKENGVQLVLGGNNVGNSSLEQEHFKTGFLGVFPDERGMYSTIGKLKLSLLLWLEYVKNYHNFHWSVFSEYMSGAYVYLFESMSKPEEVTPIGFYDYIYWTEKEVVPTIQNELGWQGASDTPATWRIDDSAYPLIDYLYLRLVGFNEFDEFYSKLIREGQIPRDEALKRCLAEHAPRIPSLMKTFEELEVTKEQVDKALEKYGAKLLPKILKQKA
jgi:glucosamine--fructose-6-phosphate aminotransferase (isomerizing)